MRQVDPAVEIPKATRFVKAEIETPNFHFEAYGASEHEALEALRAGLTQHGSQYAARVSPTWIEECMQEPRITELAMGTCYRDREALTSGESNPDREAAGGSQAKPKG